VTERELSDLPGHDTLIRVHYLDDGRTLSVSRVDVEGRKL
jgi:hypothetical protein